MEFMQAVEPSRQLRPALQSSVRRAANDGSEPDPAIVFLCCLRSQREKCGMSEKLHAVAQQNNRPEMSIGDNNKTIGACEENELVHARRVLADLTSHNDETIYRAATHVASFGETQSERERALAFTALLNDLISGS